MALNDIQLQLTLWKRFQNDKRTFHASLSVHLRHTRFQLSHKETALASRIPFRYQTPRYKGYRGCCMENRPVPRFALVGDDF